MYQYDYYLSAVKYDENGNEYYEEIDLSEIDILKRGELTTLKNIDWFTSNFDNFTQLSYFLEKEGLIKEDVSNFIITMNQNSVTKAGKNKKLLTKSIPVCGRKIIYKDDAKKISEDYIRYWVGKSENYRDLIELMKWYSAPITKKNSRTKKIYEDVKYAAITLLTSDLSDEGYILYDKYRQKIDKLIESLKTSSATETYKKIRNFVTLISYIDGGVLKLPEIERKDKPQITFEPDDIKFEYGDYDHEEYITMKEDRECREQATRRM